MKTIARKSRINRPASGNVRCAGLRAVQRGPSLRLTRSAATDHKTSRKTTVANITITTQASPPPTDGGSAVNLGDLGREPLGFSRQGPAFATGPQSG